MIKYVSLLLILSIMQVCYYVENVTCVNSTLHMVGATDNSCKLHRTCQAKKIGFVTNWEAVEEPQSLFEGEVLQ